MENTLEPPGGTEYGDNPPQFILDAMMEELGIGRINDLSLEDNPKDRRNANVAAVATLAKPPTKDIKKITRKYENEINMWQSFKPDDVSQDELLLDDLGSGQSHRLRMQATLAGSSNRDGHDLRGPRGGHSIGSHIGNSSRGGGVAGQSNKRNRVPIEEIANLLRFSDPNSVIRGGRGGGRGGSNGRVGAGHGDSVLAAINTPLAKNGSSGNARQLTVTPQKAAQRRPPQQRPIQQHSSSPILSLATPDSFFTNAKRVENTQPQPTEKNETTRQPATSQPTIKQPGIRQSATRQLATGNAPTGQPGTKTPVTQPPVTKPPINKPPITEPPVTGQPATRDVAQISKPNKAPHIKLIPEVPQNNVPGKNGATPRETKDEDLISFDLISLEDNDNWVSTSTEQLPSGYMQDMWALEKDASAVFNMIVEVTRKGMAKEKQERAHLLDSLANGVIPDGRGILSSVYALDEPPMTTESVNKYWKTRGPSFQKGLENDSIRLILEGAAAEIVRRDAPTSSDLGQPDVSDNVSEAHQSNYEECAGKIVPGNVPQVPPPNPEKSFIQINQVDSLMVDEPNSVSELVEGTARGEETMGDPKKPETTHLQYNASELLQLRARALTVDKSAFPDEIRQFVVKNANEELQKPKAIKVLGGLADSKWASPSKTNDENVAPRKVNPSPSKVNPAPKKISTTPSKVNLDPSKASFVPSNTAQNGNTGGGASNFTSEVAQRPKTMSGLGASQWSDGPKEPDTYTPLDFVSAISTATVPARPRRLGLNDSIWADSSPSTGSLTRPSINKEVVDRVVNPQLIHSSRERRKKSIEIITEATKRRVAVLEKAAAEKDAALANYSTTNLG